MSYDENNQVSILEYAKKLEGKTLRQALREKTLKNIAVDEEGNKGRYGQKIEKYYFGYDINSDSKADFPCGLELKVTPLKYLKNCFRTYVEKKKEYVIFQTMIVY